MRQDVVIKGGRAGLQLVFRESADFRSILEQLKERLEAAADFFATGLTVKVPSAAKLLTDDQREQLTCLLAGYGLSWEDRDAVDPDELGGITVIENGQSALDSAGEVLIVPKTVRGGQRVFSEGAVIVLGDVNPGAEVIAGGDVIVSGTCRGVVHAGAFGAETATITASRLMASQLRIAGLITRAPDNLGNPEYQEVARIQDHAIIIEPANAKEAFV